MRFKIKLKKMLIAASFFIMIVMIFSASSSLAYWAGSVIGASSDKNNNATNIGTWNYQPQQPIIKDYIPSNPVYNQGDIIRVIGVNGQPDTYFIVREGFNFDAGNIPGPGGNWQVLPYNPLYVGVTWRHEYTYRFGDVVYHMATNQYYIAQGTTQTRSNDTGNNPFRPGESGQNYWRLVENYSSSRSYVYREPISSTPGSIGEIHLVRYNGQMYRLIQSTTPGILPTNTTYFQLISDDIDYLYIQ